MKIDEAIRLLKENGHKATKRRKDMLTFFANANGYRTAKDLIQYMETIHQGISFDTIYRNLYLYEEIGILETTELNGEKHFQLCCSVHHHHHFICNKCGKTRDFEICPMDEVTKVLANFVIEDHKFEVYGLCPACQPA